MSYFEQIGALPHEGAHERRYVLGFVISLVCTLAAYLLVTNAVFPRDILIACIVALAAAQCAVQGICFLHIGAGKDSYMKLLVLSFAILVVVILVSGSLWIMFTLNGRMMPNAAQMEQYMQDQDGF